MIVGSLILAGGDSDRMGQPKASLPHGDSTFLAHIVDTLLTCTWPVLVIAREPDQELPPIAIEAEVLADSQPGNGPLEAMATGLRQVVEDGNCDAVFVTSCDTPFPDPKAIEWLSNKLGDHDAVITRVDGKLQSMCALYRVTVLDTVEKMRSEGKGGFQELLEQIKTLTLEEADVDAFDPQRRFLRNVNTPEEYEAVKDELGG